MLAAAAAMSALLCQALRRVVLLDARGQLLTSRKAKPVLDVLHVLCDAALSEEPHQAVYVYVEEIARRAARGVRSTQLALALAAELGLIWRLKLPEGARLSDGRQAPWGALIHRDLIAASFEKNPGRRGAPSLPFPRPWAELTNVTEVHRMEESTIDEVNDRGALNAGKKGVVDTPPPPKQAEGAGPQRPRSPAPQGRGAVAFPHKGVFLEAAGSHQDGAPFWTWLAASCDAAGWRGNLRFVGQRRRKGDGKRGGRVPLAQRHISLAAQCAGHALRVAVSRRGLEVTFEAVEAAHPLLLLDDLDAQALQALPTHGVAIVETSPGNYQATLVAWRPLSAEERLSAQRALVQRLNGDPAAVSGSQLRRFPCSVNCKRELANPFVSRLVGQPTVGTVSEELLAELLKDSAPEPAARRKPTARVDHYVGDDTDSAAEFGWVIRDLRRAGGLRGEALRAALVRKALARGKYAGAVDQVQQVERYAATTVRNAEIRLGRAPS